MFFELARFRAELVAGPQGLGIAPPFRAEPHLVAALQLAANLLAND
jgi:hypothetical protein